MGTSALLSGWWWPALTTVVGIVCSVMLGRQWAQRRRMHQLMWTIGFVFYAIAAALETYAEYTGDWSPQLFRVYIVFAASLVGFLGNGTLYLVAKNRRWGDAYFIFNCVMVAVFFYGTFTLDPADMARRLAELGSVTEISGDALGERGTYPRIMSIVFTIPGSLLLMFGSAWSIIKFARKPEFRYRVWANVLILAGTFMFAGAGAAARFGWPHGRYLSHALGGLLLLAGFLMAGTLDKGAKAAVAASRARRAAEESAPE